MSLARTSSACVVATLCIAVLLSAYAAGGAEPSGYPRVAKKPDDYGRSLGELLRRHEALQAEGRYSDAPPDYLMPQAAAPEARTLLLPPWQVGLDATRLIPLFQPGMAAVVLVAPEAGAAANAVTIAPIRQHVAPPVAPVAVDSAGDGDDPAGSRSCE